MICLKLEKKAWPMLMIWCAAFALMLPFPLLAAEEMAPGEQQAWVVNDYRYVPGSSQDNSDIGLSLCSTRCNAMTTDFRNIIDPGDWRYIRVAENRELKVELNNAFIDGYCICVADEYLVKLNEFDRP